MTATVDSGPIGGLWAVRFYSNSSCDASGYGEGEMFVGQALASNPGGGTVAILASLPGGISGSFLTATVTSRIVPWNTSEFSQCFPVP